MWFFVIFIIINDLNVNITLSRERIFHLALLSIEEDVLIDLNLIEIIKKFMSVKVRRDVCKCMRIKCC